MRASLKTFAFFSLLVGLTPWSWLSEANRALAQSTTTVATPNATDGPRQTAEKWLTRARTAMQEGRLTLADYCIRSAEKITADLSGPPLAYSVEQARQELAALRDGGSPNAATATSQANVVSPTTSAAKTGEAAVSSNQMLLQARQALAMDDVQTAKSLVERARQSGSRFDGFDTPSRVQAMIDHQNELVQFAQSGDPKQFNYQASMFLLQQASDLMAYHDWKTAESVITKAQQFPAHYEPQDTTPDQMMAKLNEQRSNAAGSASDRAQAKSDALKLLSQAQLALDQGRLDLAQSLAQQAKSLNVPENDFAKDDIHPFELELKINDAIKLQGGVAKASYTDMSASGKVVRADYDPAQDKTKNVQVNGTENVANGTNRGAQMYQNGLDALKNGDAIGAKQYFQLAFAYRDQLDAPTQKALQEHLSQLSGSVVQEAAKPVTGNDQETEVFRKLQSDVLRERATAEQMLNDKDNPNARGAVQHMTQLREQVDKSALSDTAKRPLLGIIDHDIDSFNRYIDQHRAEIENQEMNNLRTHQLAENRQRESDVDVKVQQLFDEFDKLVEEQRFAEAEVTARQAVALRAGQARSANAGLEGEVHASSNGFGRDQRQERK